MIDGVDVDVRARGVLSSLMSGCGRRRGCVYMML